MIDGLKRFLKKEPKLVTNDYIKGYITALDNLKSVVNAYKIDAMDQSAQEAFQDVVKHIEHVRENYKLLVKDLNKK